MSIRLSAQARVAQSAFAEASAARPNAPPPVPAMGSRVSRTRVGTGARLIQPALMHIVQVSIKTGKAMPACALHALAADK